MKPKMPNDQIPGEICPLYNEKGVEIGKHYVPKVNENGQKKFVVGTSTKMNFEYENKPAKWMHGCVVVTPQGVRFFESKGSSFAKK